jgi:hypothetical protein
VSRRWALLLFLLVWGLFAAVCFWTGVSTAKAAEVYGGDSIACGAAQAASMPVRCRVGAGSCEIAQKVPKGLWGWVVLSAGVNDQGRCVRQVRASVGPAARVIWIVSPPRYTHARAAQLATGQTYGDRFVTYVPGRDGLHPRSYPELVRAVHATEALPGN